MSPQHFKTFWENIGKSHKELTNGFFSSYICGFCNIHSTQHSFLRFVECAKGLLDYGRATGAVLIDLSRAIYCLNHDQLIEKLGVYGFG